jgi:rhodanese-related sulfurtransferase
MQPVVDVKRFAWIVMLVIFAGTLPIAVNWFLFARIPRIEPSQAKALLDQTNSQAVLVDVRAPEVFARNHVAGATNWFYAAISALENSNQVPANLQGKQLLLICDSGFLSAMSARKLAKIGLVNVRSVQGGMEEWMASRSTGAETIRYYPMKLLEQWLAVIVAFGVKPVYMLLSLGLIIWL